MLVDMSSCRKRLLRLLGPFSHYHGIISNPNSVVLSCILSSCNKHSRAFLPVCSGFRERGLGSEYKNFLIKALTFYAWYIWSDHLQARTASRIPFIISNLSNHVKPPKSPTWTPFPKHLTSNPSRSPSQASTEPTMQYSPSQRLKCIHSKHSFITRVFYNISSEKMARIC